VLTKPPLWGGSKHSSTGKLNTFSLATIPTRRLETEESNLGLETDGVARTSAPLSSWSQGTWLTAAPLRPRGFTVPLSHLSLALSLPPAQANLAHPHSTCRVTYWHARRSAHFAHFFVSSSYLQCKLSRSLMWFGSRLCVSSPHVFRCRVLEMAFRSRGELRICHWSGF
jgi:hypothetical protein